MTYALSPVVSSAHCVFWKNQEVVAVTHRVLKKKNAKYNIIKSLKMQKKKASRSKRAEIDKDTELLNDELSL